MTEEIARREDVEHRRGTTPRRYRRLPPLECAISLHEIRAVDRAKPAPETEQTAGISRPQNVQTGISRRQHLPHSPIGRRARRSASDGGVRAGRARRSRLEERRCRRQTWTHPAAEEGLQVRPFRPAQRTTVDGGQRTVERVGCLRRRTQGGTESGETREAEPVVADGAASGEDSGSAAARVAQILLAADRAEGCLFLDVSWYTSSCSGRNLLVGRRRRDAGRTTPAREERGGLFRDIDGGPGGSGKKEEKCDGKERNGESSQGPHGEQDV